MKPYKLFAHLFTLLLITFTTAQARQQNLNLDLNNNNSKRKYVHGYQEDLEKILENVQFKTLQKPLEDLYENGITRPVNNQQPIPLTYFVVGPTGAGKSTFIFTLQGNTVIETPSGDWGSDVDNSKDDNNNNTTQNKTSVNNLNNNYGEIGDLTLTKTIKRSTPKVGDSFYGVTEGVKIYYYIDDNKGQKSINHNEGKKSIEDNKEQESMAFCDTEGFLGKRKKNNSPAQEIVGTYAPYFVLKANTIGGIVFLISEQDIRGGRGKNLFLCAEFIQNYFATGMVGKNQEELKKSILLVITKCPEKKEKATIKELARFIKFSYEDYYNAQGKNNKNKPKSKQKVNQKGTPLGLLKPFFSLFLTKDVAKHEMKTTDFFKLMDKNKVRFFYPYIPQNVTKIRKKLRNLSPIPPKYLSLYDNPVSQALVKKIINRTQEINELIRQTRICKNEMQANFLREKGDKQSLKKLKEQLQQKKEEYATRNKQLLNDTSLVLEFEDSHCRTFAGSCITDYGTYLYEVKGHSWWSRWVGMFTDYRDFQEYQHLKKTFRYTQGEPIYQIDFIDVRDGTMTWRNPGMYRIKKDFNGFKDSKFYSWWGELTAKYGKGIHHDSWVLAHKGTYQRDVDFTVRFYSQKCERSSTKIQVQDNKNKMQEIDEMIKKLEISTEQRKNKSRDSYFNYKEKVHKYTEELASLNLEMNMIVCWSERIFKKEGGDKDLVLQCLQNYNEMMYPKYINLQKNNEYKGNNSNKKHVDFQPGSNLNFQDKEECKEDEENNNNQNNSSPNTLAQTVPGLTALLAGLLAKQN